MLDTVTLREEWPLKVALPRGHRIKLKNNVTICTDRDGKAIKWAEFSAATVLHGHNGHLIENQQQLDAAIAKVAESLDIAAHVPDPSEWQPSRMDVGWNFDLPALPIIIAHGALRVPGIRSGATLFDGGEGVSWLGTNSDIKILLYDKSRKNGVPGSVLRAETQLKGHQLQDHLAGRDWKDINVQHQIFRKIMTGIPTIPNPVAVNTWQEALAQEPPEFRNCFLARLAHRPPRTFRTWRRLVETAAVHLNEAFSWAEILPVDGLPVPVNVERSQRSRRR